MNYKMFICNISSMFLFLILALSSNIEMTSIVNIETNKVLAQVDERFLSVALGMINKNWRQLDLHNPRVINMAKALSPAFIRLGGTGADLATFNQTKSSNEVSELKTDKDVSLENNNRNYRDCRDISQQLQKKRKNITITRDDWIDLNRFTAKVNWTLLFDVNVILKRADGCWNSNNFQELLKFSSGLNYGPIAWELGKPQDMIIYYSNRRNLILNYTSKQLNYSVDARLHYR